MGISSKIYIAELLEDAGLSATDKKKVKHFSVGMKQRLGIALALIGSPELSKIAASYGIIKRGELKKQILRTELTEDLEEYFLSLTGGVSHD